MRDARHIRKTHPVEGRSVYAHLLDGYGFQLGGAAGDTELPGVTPSSGHDFDDTGCELLFECELLFARSA